ncbi:MAG: hypothetical protein ACODAE_02515 [Gemmatimonadota bacterium]
MPIGAFINVIPPGAFVAIHAALLLVGVYLAYRSYGAGASTFGLAFVLYALAEVFYLTYHLDLTVILFAHTVAEVLNAVAFVMLFTAGVSRAVGSRPEAATRAGAPLT